MPLAALLSLVLVTADPANGAGSAAPPAPARDGALSAVLPAGARVQQLETGRAFQFAEGPVWAPARDGRAARLIFSDIPAGTVFAFAPETGALDVLRSPSGHANGLAIDGKGLLLACEHDGRVTRTEADGRVATIADAFEGKGLNSPNDLAVHHDGSIYFTDPPYGLRPPLGGIRERELDFCGVYRIPPEGGEPALLTRELRTPNGIAFSPDFSRCYIADTSQAEIRVYAVRADGSLADGARFARLTPPDLSDGSISRRLGSTPDGLGVDERGNVYCAARGGVWVFNTAGEHLGTIAVPETPSNLCFGGDDGKTLFITARTGLYMVRLAVRGADAPPSVPPEQESAP